MIKLYTDELAEQHLREPSWAGGRCAKVFDKPSPTPLKDNRVKEPMTKQSNTNMSWEEELEKKIYWMSGCWCNYGCDGDGYDEAKADLKQFISKSQFNLIDQVIEWLKDTEKTHYIYKPDLLAYLQGLKEKL